MTSPGLRLRPSTPADFPAYRALVYRAFGEDPAGEPAAVAAEQREFEASAGVLAESDGEIVGSALAFPAQFCVPGGALVPAAAVTGVSVASQWRRNGIFRQLMTQQLTSLRTAGGQPLAALYASEAPLYGRFGYGPAAPRVNLDIPLPAPLRVGTTPESESAGVRLVVSDAAAARVAMTQLAQQLLRQRPGRRTLGEADWDGLLADPAGRRDGGSALVATLASVAGEVAGYSLHRTSSRWEDGSPRGVVSVVAVEAASAAATAALWRHLLSLDLMGAVRVPNRPPDDPVLALLENPRAARPRVSDGLWVRLVDVAVALAARRYAAGLDVVLELSDVTCPANAGRWRLQTADSGDSATTPTATLWRSATCRRVDDAPDLQLDTRDLASAYLGGGSICALVRAGLVSELTADAALRTDRAFASDAAPWCQWGF